MDEDGWRAAVAWLKWDAGRVAVADGFAERLLGLMPYAGRRRGEAPTIVFPHCRSVHTCLMRAPVDVAFVDAAGNVLDVFWALRPWRLVSNARAAWVVERLTPAEGAGDAG